MKSGKAEGFPLIVQSTEKSNIFNSSLKKKFPISKK